LNRTETEAKPNLQWQLTHKNENAHIYEVLLPSGTLSDSKAVSQSVKLIEIQSSGIGFYYAAWLWI